MSLKRTYLHRKQSGGYSDRANRGHGDRTDTLPPHCLTRRSLLTDFLHDRDPVWQRAQPGYILYKRRIPRPGWGCLPSVLTSFPSDGLAGL